MKITLKDDYKSLKPFESEDLNGLTVITGKNGSGKTQLLELINKKAKNDPSVISIRLELSPTTTRIQSEGIIKESSTQIGHDQWKKIVKNQLDSFKNISPSVRKLINYVVDNNLQTSSLSNTKATLLSDEPEYIELLAKAFSEMRQQPVISNDQVNINVERKTLRQFFTDKNEGLFRFVRELCAFTGKKEQDLTDADFYNTPIQEHLIDSNDLFSSQVELIFYNYAKRRDLNRKNYFYQKEEGDKNGAIPDAEFTDTFTPPWETINEILEKHNIDFYFKGIGKSEFTTDAPIDFKLYKKSTDEIIPFSDLSSGEKVIIGLVLKLFTSEYYGESMTFPELLILDEPDAHLHPQMSKLLLDVLEQTFVNKYDIKIIITTHSPSTIALASENQIFQLTNGEGTSLKKVTKDDALKILTSFIPTLSIDYKNHRQAFVESPTDVLYYQSLHDKHSQSKQNSFKLYFISNSAGKSNCSQVYKIVDEMRKSGNLTSYGIVDWDLTNTPNQFVLVHGLNERYSIENFILDPIYIVCLLVDLNNAHGIMEKIGIDKTYNQYLLGSEPSERLQAMIKVFFTDFAAKFAANKYESDLMIVEYYNGHKLQIPKWYLQMRGHDIFSKIRAVYPAIEGKYKTEIELLNALTIIVAKLYPFVPIDSIKKIEEIGNCG